MRIKTRESLKTIKTFDRADTLAQKSKSGISSLHNSAEQTQNVGYESETDYAGSELQDKEERIARMTVVGANKVGRWGVRETRKNIHKWRNRPRKSKSNSKLKQLPSPKRKARKAPKKGIKTASKGTKTAAKATVKGTKAAVKGTIKAAQLIKKAAIATVKFVKVAVKAIIAAAKAVVAAVKGIVAAIVAGGWVAVVIIVVICLIALILGLVFGPFASSEESSIQTLSVITELEEDYSELIEKQLKDYEYQEIEYRGSMTEWSFVLSVYTVKNNLITDKAVDFDLVATFDIQDFKNIFWDLNSISSYIEDRIVDSETRISYLIIESVSMTAEEVADFYGFSEEQKEMLFDLVSPRNEGIWDAFIPLG